MTAAARPHRPLLAYAAASVALATLGACSGGDPGPADTTAPPANSTSSTTSETASTPAPAPSSTSARPNVPPGVPKAAQARTPKGAEAFARFYLGQINRAFSRPDATAFDGLYVDSCDTCSTYKRTAEDFEKRGRKQAHDLLEATSATAANFDQKAATVNVFFTQHAVAVVDKSGKTVSRTASGSGAFVFTLAHNGDYWTVTNLKAAAS